MSVKPGPSPLGAIPIKPEPTGVDFFCETPVGEPEMLAAALWLASLVQSLMGRQLRQLRAFFSPDQSQLLLTLTRDPVTWETVSELRLLFWATRAHGVVRTGASISGAQRAVFLERMAQWEELGPPLRTALVQAWERVPAPLRVWRDRGPLVDVTAGAGDPAMDLKVASINGAGVFFECVHAPVVVDLLHLRLHAPALSVPVDVDAKVVNVRRGSSPPAEKAPGFGVVYLNPTVTMLESLACFGVTQEDTSRRYPRYPVTARIRYANESEFSDDYVSNLSFGGAFIRTGTPALPHSTLHVELELPSGTLVHTWAKVVTLRADGMGVKFEEDSLFQAALAGELRRIACRPRKALIVEDEPAWQRLLALHLGRVGVKCTPAAQGKEGLHLLTEDLLNLDVVLADLSMPQMGGLALVRAIRETGGEMEIPIIILTGSPPEDVAQEAHRAGANAVFSKETPLDELARNVVDLATQVRMRTRGSG